MQFTFNSAAKSAFSFSSILYIFIKFCGHSQTVIYTTTPPPQKESYFIHTCISLNDLMMEVEEVEVEEGEVVGWHGGGCGTIASCSTQNIHNPNNNEDRNKCE